MRYSELIKSVSDLEEIVVHNREMGHNFLETPFELEKLEKILGFARKMLNEPSKEMVDAPISSNCEYAQNFQTIPRDWIPEIIKVIVARAVAET